MPKISVIVPVYKVEKYIHRCVDSILNQTFTDFELILVDDGSPDSCGAICDDYAAKDSRVVVIHQENGGLSTARNAGIDWAFANSDSEWLTFIDSDDWIHQECLELLYNSALTHDVQISLCEMVRTREDKHTDRTLHNELSQKISVVDLYTGQYGSPVVACARLFYKSLFSAVRFPNGKLHEDVYTTHKLFAQCEYLGYIRAELYYYYYNSEGIMLRGWSPKRMDEIHAYEERLKFFWQRDKKIPLKKAAVSFLWVLVSQLRQIDEMSSSEYGKYQKQIRKKLRISLYRFRKKDILTFKGYEWALEAAYPKIMQLYWLLKRIKSVRKK